MQFPWQMKEASLEVAGTLSPPLYRSHPPPFLHAVLSKPQVGGFFFGDINVALSAVKRYLPTTGSALLQWLEQNPVNQVSQKQMKNESSPVRHPLNSEAGSWHASSIIFCFTMPSYYL